MRYAAQGVSDTIVVFNGDVLTQVDLPCLIAFHRGRRSRATIVLTPVDNPTAYGLVETDADGNIRRFLEKPKPEEITCDTINAGIYVLEPDTFDRIPEDVAWSIERSFFPSFIERGETFLASIYRDYWIDIGTPEKYMQVHRDIMDGRYSMPPFNGQPGVAWVAPTARIDGRRDASTGPLFIDEGCSRESRCAHRTVHGAWQRLPGGRGGQRVRRRSSGPGRTSAREAQVTDTIIGRGGQIGRNAVIAACCPGRPDTHRRIQPTMNPHIFKAYDVRGIYPAELDEQVFHEIGRAFVAYLKARRIGVGRDMRVSSPSLAAAFIAGAREQGAEVVDYGMIATDMIYYAVGDRRPRRRRADHGVAQPEAVQRLQDGGARQSCR